MQHRDEVVYQIDRKDLLIFVNEQWDRFAENNDSADLAGINLHQQSIWDFIQDSETKHLHRMLLQKVRSEYVILDLPFRCDSPSLRRYMQMNISPLADGQVEYRCRLIKAEAREPVPFISEEVANGDALLRMCSWCKKIDIGRNLWLEIEEAIKCMGLFSQQRLPKISHTICRTCVEALEDEE